MSSPTESFLVRSGLLMLINKLPDRVRREDARNVLEWGKEFQEKKTEFFDDQFSVGESSSKHCDDSYDEMVRAFAAIGTFLRHLSDEAIEAFRSGDDVYEMPSDVKELRELAETSAAGRGSAALISRYLATKGQHKRAELAGETPD